MCPINYHKACCSGHQSFSLYLSAFNHQYFSYSMDHWRHTDEVHPCTSLCYSQPPAQDHWVGALLKKLSFPSRDCYFSSEGAKWLFTGSWGCQLSRGGRCTSQGDIVQKQTPAPTGKERQDPAEIQWASMPLWSQRNCNVPYQNEWKIHLCQSDDYAFRRVKRDLASY